MTRFGDDLRRPPYDLPSAHRMQPLQPGGEDRNVRGSDFEQPVTAERATAAALEVLRLRVHHRAEEFVGVLQNAPVGHVGLGNRTDDRTCFPVVKGHGLAAAVFPGS